MKKSAGGDRCRIEHHGVAHRRRPDTVGYLFQTAPLRELSVTATRKRAADDIPNTQTSRVETVLATLLDLMTADQRKRCPRIAACVAAHLDAPSASQPCAHADDDRERA